MPTNTRSRKKRKLNSTELSNLSKSRDLLCKECSDAINKRDKRIDCTACLASFHIDCKLIPRKKLQSMKDSNEKWYCSSECKKHIPGSSSKIGVSGVKNREIIHDTEDDTDVYSDDDEMDIEQIEMRVDDITENSSVKNILLSIVQSQKFLSNKMDRILKENTTLKTAVENYKKINQGLFEKVETLTEEVNILKQEQFERNLIMLGIPQESDMDNVVNAVLKTTKKIGSELTEADILEVKRLGNASSKSDDRQTTRTPPILIKLKNTLLKKEILAKKKEYGDLRAKSLFTNAMEGHRIFINNYMTPYNIALLKEAADLKKNYGYAYVWFGGNNVWAKKTIDRNSPPIKITSTNTIQRLKNKQ